MSPQNEALKQSSLSVDIHVQRFPPFLFLHVFGSQTQTQVTWTKGTQMRCMCSFEVELRAFFFDSGTLLLPKAIDIDSPDPDYIQVHLNSEEQNNMAALSTFLIHFSSWANASSWCPACPAAHLQGCWTASWAASWSGVRCPHHCLT